MGAAVETAEMDSGSKLPVAVILVVLGGALILVGGYWFGMLLVACGLVGLMVAYGRRGGSPQGIRQDGEWSRKQAVFWALQVSGCGPLGVLVAKVVGRDLSRIDVAIALGMWVVLFPLMLLSVWGRVRLRQRS